jgi:predicted lipoprotein with Yx(FWY)xxD motif
VPDNLKVGSMILMKICRLGYWKMLLTVGLILVTTNTLGCSSGGEIYTINEEPIPTIGYYLTDGAGMTLYYTTADTAGKSNVSGLELNDWPIFYNSNIIVPPALKRSDFSSIKRPDGKLQTTYKRWPLYYYSIDAEPNDMVGQGIGGVWFIANPNIPKATPSP